MGIGDARSGTSFASDNYAGAHPDVLAAVVAANEGHLPAYGHDAGTARAIEVVREALGSPTAEIAFVFNGTAANVLCLDALLRSHDAVVCAATAHVATDECGAPERLLGVKLLTVDTPDGKLTPAHVDAAAVGFGDEHRVQPRVVSISQSTELGTVYTPSEIAALSEAAHELGMQLHVDGARLANAAAALGCSLADLTSACGVDALSLGATKNGGLGAEAVVLLRPRARSPLAYRRKQSMQLASKMRYLAAQLEALYGGDLWLRNAAHANAMARRLADALPSGALAYPAQANAVFVALPHDAIPALQARWPFYVWDEPRGVVRLMAAWDTRPEDVDELAAALVAALTA